MQYDYRPCRGCQREEATVRGYCLGCFGRVCSRCLHTRHLDHDCIRCTCALNSSESQK